LIFSIETMPTPPCGLTKQEVLALRPDVPLKDGLGCVRIATGTPMADSSSADALLESTPPRQQEVRITPTVSGM
jgi:hypothetical protein